MKLTFLAKAIVNMTLFLFLVCVLKSKCIIGIDNNLS